MLTADPQNPTMTDRYMTAVTGFDIMLPPGATDDFRLTLVYFSGEFNRGDVHLHAYIQDVVPSTLSQLRDLAHTERKRALQLLSVLMPGMSDKQSAYLGRCYESVSLSPGSRLRGGLSLAAVGNRPAPAPSRWAPRDRQRRPPHAKPRTPLAR